MKKIVLLSLMVVVLYITGCASQHYTHTFTDQPLLDEPPGPVWVWGSYPH